MTMESRLASTAPIASSCKGRSASYPHTCFTIRLTSSTRPSRLCVRPHESDDHAARSGFYADGKRAQGESAGMQQPREAQPEGLPRVAGKIPGKNRSRADVAGKTHDDGINRFDRDADQLKSSDGTERKDLVDPGLLFRATGQSRGRVRLGLATVRGR